MNGQRSPRRTANRLLVLGLYALVALVAPLLHHDFDCELKSKIHCDACIAATGVARLDPPITLTPQLEQVQRQTPESRQATSDGSLLRLPGRAPPMVARLV